MPRKKKVKQTADPNLIIQFVGKRRTIDKKTGKIKLVATEAPTFRKNGQKVFKLPSHENQIKGFTHPDAGKLLSLYRREFKKKVSKGKK